MKVISRHINLTEDRKNIRMETDDEILKLSKLSIDDIHKMCIDMEDILIHNRNNFIKLTTNPETVSFLDDYIVNPFVKLS